MSDIEEISRAHPDILTDNVHRAEAVENPELAFFMTGILANRSVQRPNHHRARTALSEILPNIEPISPAGPKPKRALLPNLLGPLSRKNARWLKEQQQKEKDHKRAVARAHCDR